MLMKNEYAFLSNFYPCQIEYNGMFYKNAEAAFQAQKEKCDFFREPYQYMNPSEAKRAGRRADLRPDWESVKDNIMYEVVKAKFEQNPGFKEMLISVTEPIVEDNWWNDTYWGVCNGKGLNKLGQILTRIRQEFIDNNK